jgi:hypothetical protein
MRRRSILLIFALVIFAVSGSAQGVYTPERGSAERKAILDALRVPVERDLKQTKSHSRRASRAG